MLLFFETENFRSFKEPALLSMVAANAYHENEEQLIDQNLPGLGVTRVLRSAMILGANAAGKSNLYDAMAVMRRMVLYSDGAIPAETWPCHPFALDKGCCHEPTRFLAAFVRGGVRYEYEFSYDADRVTDETLRSFPVGRARLVFRRVTDGDGNATVTCGNKSMERAFSLAASMVDKRTLLLSFVGNRTQARGVEKVVEALLPPFDWFEHGLNFYDHSPQAANSPRLSGEILDGTSGTVQQRELIKSVVRAADVGIAEMSVGSGTWEEFVAQQRPDLSSSNPMPGTSATYKWIEFTHDGAYDADSRIRESSGTLELFYLMGPVSQALVRGETLVIDELGASLHSLLVSEVVRLFLSPTTNPNDAQLIFTSHAPYLLCNSLLRRDQVWFAEKDGHGATELYPLSDFKPRKGESLVNGYLGGRYDGVPSVEPIFGLEGTVR